MRNNNNISTIGIIQIILIIGAIYLASNGTEGWGWLLFTFFFLAIWD